MAETKTVFSFFSLILLGLFSQNTIAYDSFEIRCPYEVFINQEFNCSYAIQTQQPYKYISISFDDKSSPYSFPINKIFPYLTHYYATQGNFNISAVILNSNLFAKTLIVVLDANSLKIINFTCNSNGFYQDAFNLEVWYVGNKLKPLAIDFDDGDNYTYYPLTDGLNRLVLSKSYSYLGQFEIKASLSSEIASCFVLVQYAKNLTIPSPEFNLNFSYASFLEVNQTFNFYTSFTQKNYGGLEIKFYIDFKDGSSINSPYLSSYTVSKNPPYPELSSILTNKSGILIFNFWCNGYCAIDYIEIYANRPGYVKIMFVMLKQCLNYTAFYKCIQDLTKNETIDFLDLTLNVTLPTVYLNKGYNLIGSSVFGSIGSNIYMLPLLISNRSEDLLAISVDVSSGTFYSDYTFKSFDYANQRVSSLKKLNKNTTWRYLVKFKATLQNDYNWFKKMYTKPGVYNVSIYCKEVGFVYHNLTVNGTLSQTTTTSTTPAINTSTNANNSLYELTKLSALLVILNISANSSYDINIFSLNVSLLTQLLNKNYDLNNCLKRCSYNGLCQINELTNNFKCSCFNGYIGGACEVGTNLCATSTLCLNNGTCVYEPNSTSLYKCECRSSKYYGKNCESEVDLCSNTTCLNRGICKVDESTFIPYCKCLEYYSGDKCEFQSFELIFRRNVIKASLIISIISIIIFYLMFILNDLIEFVLCKRIHLKKHKLGLRFKKKDIRKFHL